ncbi:hypothetical protein D1007_12304 [Hordeum vulgare]|nr:hypothetical protein D1007_12304 [Hordeum vulgare]
MSQATTMHFGLQQHHLAANTVLQLAAYITLYEGFLGIELRLDLWRRLFFFKQQSVPDGTVGTKRMTVYDATLVHHRTLSGFPKLPLQDSVKNWQKGFFYMKNVDPKNDCINLPPFVIEPPIVKLIWKSTLPKPAGDEKLISAHLDLLKVKCLMAEDLLATMVARRILPLPHQPHLICQMSGRHDPCRLLTKELRASKVAERVNLISTASMDEGDAWEWGMAPYDREHPSPMVYRQPAADLEVSDPEEIEDVYEVEPRPAGSEEVEEVADSEGTEPAGEFLASGLLD